jgi:streptogramin lyase
VEAPHRILALLAGCLAAGALAGPGLATARPVGLIREFEIGGNVPDLAAGPDGNVWFTLSHGLGYRGPAAIGRITPRGKVTKFSAGLNPGSNPLNIVAGPDGNLWFGDDGRIPAIGRITPQGAITEFSAGLGLRHGGPWEIVVGADGNLWFNHSSFLAPIDEAIGRITPQGRSANSAAACGRSPRSKGRAR